MISCSEITSESRLSCHPLMQWRMKFSIDGSRVLPQSVFTDQSCINVILFVVNMLNAFHFGFLFCNYNRIRSFMPPSILLLSKDDESLSQTFQLCFSLSYILWFCLYQASCCYSSPRHRRLDSWIKIPEITISRWRDWNKKSTDFLSPISRIMTQLFSVVTFITWNSVIDSNEVHASYLSGIKMKCLYAIYHRY